jgi:hypothetical protein
MKLHPGALIYAVTLCLFLAPVGKASDTVHHQTFEYATIRWSGRDNTHVIRPNGQVEFAAPQLAKLKKPERVDDRAFYMNVLMNALAKEGYEFAGISNDEIIMKRSVTEQ